MYIFLLTRQHFLTFKNSFADNNFADFVHFREWFSRTFLPICHRHFCRFFADIFADFSRTFLPIFSRTFLPIFRGHFCRFFAENFVDLSRPFGRFLTDISQILSRTFLPFFEDVMPVFRGHFAIFFLLQKFWPIRNGHFCRFFTDILPTFCIHCCRLLRTFCCFLQSLVAKVLQTFSLIFANFCWFCNIFTDFREYFRRFCKLLQVFRKHF